MRGCVSAAAKMPMSLVPEKFAKFAKFDSALEQPTQPPSPVSDGRGG